MDTREDNQKSWQRNQTAFHPYANLVNCGLQHSQISALHTLLPDLEPDTPVLPCGSVDLGNSYVLLRAQDTTGTVLNREPTNAI